MRAKSNPVRCLKGIFDSFGVPLNHTMRREIIFELDHNGLVLWRSKYGWLRILTGYTETGVEYVEAPMGWATSSVGTFLHINYLSPATIFANDFSDFEFSGTELIPINRFWKWWLLKVKKIPHRTASTGYHGDVRTNGDATIEVYHER